MARRGSRIDLFGRALATGLGCATLHVAILASGGLYADAPLLALLLSIIRYGAWFSAVAFALAVVGALIGRVLRALNGSGFFHAPFPAATLFFSAFVLLWGAFALRVGIGSRRSLVAAGIIACAAGVFIGLSGLTLWMRGAGPARAGMRRGRSPVWIIAVVLLWDLSLLAWDPRPPRPTPVSEEQLGAWQLNELRPAARDAVVEPGRNLLLLSFDSLRADHLGCYGYGRPTSPSLDALAESGVRFENAIAQRPSTSASVASIQTGRYSIGHGVFSSLDRLGDGNHTLAEMLKADGYRTAAVVTNGNLYPAFGFDQGFDEYIYGHQNARTGADHAIAWLTSHDSDPQPWFLWVHFTDPHPPYSPPQTHAELFQGEDGVDREIDRYDGEIHYADAELGRIVSWLRENESDGPLPLVAFVADHGQSLGEHGAESICGQHPYEESARVPLILSLPGRLPAGTLRERVVSVVDLLPTLLDALGTEVPPLVGGNSFLPLALGSDPSGPRPFAYIEAGDGGRVAPGRTRALRWADRKYVQRLTDWARYPAGPLELIWTIEARLGGALARDEFYDLTADPAETENLIGSQGERGRAARRLLEDFAREISQRPARVPTSEPRELDDASREALKNLGHVE